MSQPPPNLPTFVRLLDPEGSPVRIPADRIDWVSVYRDPLGLARPDAPNLTRIDLTTGTFGVVRGTVEEVMAEVWRQVGGGEARGGWGGKGEEEEGEGHKKGSGAAGDATPGPIPLAPGQVWRDPEPAYNGKHGEATITGLDGGRVQHHAVNAVGVRWSNDLPEDAFRETYSVLLHPAPDPTKLPTVPTGLAASAVADEGSGDDDEDDGGCGCDPDSPCRHDERARVVNLFAALISGEGDSGFWVSGLAAGTPPPAHLDPPTLLPLPSTAYVWIKWPEGRCWLGDFPGSGGVYSFPAEGGGDRGEITRRIAEGLYGLGYRGASAGRPGAEKTAKIDYGATVEPLPPCGFMVAWVGPCKDPGSEAGGRCPKHAGLTCRSCGAPATRECDRDGIQFVCGYPLCDDCEHGTPEPGKGGMFGLGGGHRRKARAVNSTPFPTADALRKYTDATGYGPDFGGSSESAPSSAPQTTSPRPLSDDFLDVVQGMRLARGPYSVDEGDEKGGAA